MDMVMLSGCGFQLTAYKSPIFQSKHLLTRRKQLFMMISSAHDLPPLLTRNQRLLGLDVGEKTIGLALSDVGRMIATPFKTIQRGKFTTDAESLIAIIREHDVGALILGYPVNMDGSEGPRCQSTRQFARNLAEKIDMPMLLADERMSTLAVTRTMLDADLSRKRRAELVDKMAASYILQSVLDTLAAIRP
jgi:putative Holliday junction resolvase